MNSIIDRIGQKKFLKLIDNLYDEVFIYDNNYNIVYVNNACKRHYGKSQNEIIGKNFYDFINEDTWNNSTLPHVYRDKKTYAAKQHTIMDSDITTIAVPIFDDNEELEYVVMNVRDTVFENDLLLLNKSVNNKTNNKNCKILADSVQMKNILKLIDKISKIDATCTIIGESGTGKTMLARHIHDISPRKDNPFVCINCSSIPKELIESELFGYTKGSFTGAKNDGRIGLFESANNGTILLDEISELPYGAQAKLLHVIQDKEFIPIGANKPIKVDVKIITATNRDLKQLVKNGEFREDLYYRINIFEILVPPLRERKKDVKNLIFYYLNLFCKKYEITHKLSDPAMDILLNYNWPGNVRELRHIIERLIVTIEDMLIKPKDLPKTLFPVSNEKSQISNLIDFEKNSFNQLIENYESNLISNAYEKYKTTRKIAEKLDISQTKASKLIRKYIK
ncbi:sigma 54-interacting transcriptional regulator [Clostridiaceae bacterium HSG29]|nr:sigma 54-interacting transcriptional regulator [Clostridiaceae bacterium HSG29]